MRLSARKNIEGFTLLEILIAMGIMVIVLTSIFSIESGSILATERAREMTTVSMLAKDAMVDFELKFQEKPFNEVAEEESGQFEEPFQAYSWTRTVKEVEFPNLGIGNAQSGKDSGGAENQTELLSKLVTNFLSKALREVTITVKWKKLDSEQTFSLSQYWVDLNHEFSLSE
ncbi:MAG: prepilin-type N-terminal cleavage/methylation domain-containing protein [Bacteriovoracia bacterium]